VMEVLAAFIREHSQEQWPEAEPGAQTPARTTRPDVQAAVTVIGRRDPRHDRERIDLARANLARANLTDANLTDVNLTRANLTDADLFGADLTRANLVYANLTDTYLTRANLSRAILSEDVRPPDGWVRDPGSGRLRSASEGTGNADN
jgi:uncharacterized protein YjbI with pentapeptide repeats